MSQYLWKSLTQDAIGVILPVIGRAHQPVAGIHRERDDLSSGQRTAIHSGVFVSCKQTFLKVHSKSHFENCPGPAVSQHSNTNGNPLNRG